MKYLFFDVECSNCFNGNGKICEFGYVLTDEDFNVIKKDDLPMSPGKGRESRFNLRGRKDQKDLELAYDEEFYYEQPEFPHFYKQIKDLMEQEDTICFAWASENDILHLFHTCKRYKKDPIKYVCYDVQKIVQDYLGINNQMALKAACQKIVGPNSVIKMQEHLSRDDAHMTMLILEAISVLDRKKSNEILSEHPNAKDDSEEFVANFIGRQKAKAEMKRKHDVYKAAAKEDEEKIEMPEYQGKRVNLSGQIKKEIEDIEGLLADLRSKGYIFSEPLPTTDIFICLNAENKGQVQNRLGDTTNCEFVELKDFLDR